MLQVGEGHGHIIGIVAPATIIKVDRPDCGAVKEVVPLMQVRMDKPIDIAGVASILDRCLHPLGRRRQHGQRDRREDGSSFA
jgi:hypothetical protein